MVKDIFKRPNSMEGRQFYIFYSKNMKEIAFIVLLFSNLIFSAHISTNFQMLGFQNEAVLDLLRPFFANNLTVKTNLKENIVLDMKNEIQSLFQFVFSDQNASALILPNFREISSLKWSKNINQAELLFFLTEIFTDSLLMFYRMLNDSSFLQSEFQSQQWLFTILSTIFQPAIENVLALLSEKVFWNKRCILSMQPNLLDIVQKKSNELSLSQKQLLVPIIIRMNVVHRLIFPLS